MRSPPRSIVGSGTKVRAGSISGMTSAWLVGLALQQRGCGFDPAREAFDIEGQRQHRVFAQRAHGFLQAFAQLPGAVFIETREGQAYRLARGILFRALGRRFGHCFRAPFLAAPGESVRQGIGLARTVRIGGFGWNVACVEGDVGGEPAPFAQFVDRQSIRSHRRLRP